MTDRNGNVTRYEYDAAGMLMGIVDPVGMRTRLSYANGKLESIAAPDGRTTQIAIDSSGNLMNATLPDSGRWGWGYDARRLMTAKTDPRGLTSSSTYDEAGRYAGSTRADGSTLRFTPVAALGLSSSSMASQPAADTDYSNTATMVDGVGNVMRYDVGDGGLILSATDQVGKQFQLSRNEEELVTAMVNGRGDQFDFRYDTKGNLIESRDQVPNGDGSGSQDRFIYPTAAFPVASLPKSLFLADFNGDDRLDLVSVGSFGVITMSLGRANGQFAPAVVVATVRSGLFAAAADLDADGNVDLVVSSASRVLDLLFGKGDGTFEPAVTMPLDAGGLHPHVAAQDVNADGTVDLVVINGSSDEVSVLLGNGGRTFPTRVDYPVGEGPTNLRLADVNRDGRIDLIVANGLSDNVSTLLGNGDGTFRPATNIGVGDDPRSVRLADVNEDGRPDLVAANRLGVAVRIGRGDGTFGAMAQFAVGGTSPASVFATDLNADGHIDLVTANLGSDNLSILHGRGDGSFASPTTLVAGRSPNAVVAVDINGDERSDLIALNEGSSNFSVYLANPNRTFTGAAVVAGVTDSAFAILADVNVDGRLDLISGNSDPATGGQDGTVTVSPGRGDGSFGAAVTLATTDIPGSALAADINGDGLPDIVSANQGFPTEFGSFTGTDVSVFLNLGNNTFSPSINSRLDAAPSKVFAADFNRDGRLDLVTDHGRIDSVALLLGNGDGTFAPFTAVAGGVLNSVADINGDGLTDILAANGNGGSVLLGRGDGTFGEPTSYAVANATFVADVNQDGRADRIDVNAGPDTITVGLGRADGTFQAGTPYTTDRDPFSVVVVDVDGDGRLDLVSGNVTGDSVSVLLGNGDGTFGETRHFTAGSSAESVAAGDLNGDGLPDLAVAGGTVGVLLNGGSSSAVRSAAAFDPLFAQPTSGTDGRGNVVTYDIDPANGNFRSVSRPEGQTEAYTYLPSGQVDTMTDALGHVTDYDYDAAGRVVKMTWGLGGK